MRTFCITIPEEPGRLSDARCHFSKVGVDAKFINGINAELSGLLTTNSYENGYMIPRKQVGLVLSHFIAWTVCSFLPDESFLILEDDCEFPENWQERFIKCLNDTPSDFDILLIGSCNAEDKDKTHIAGDIWEVKWPFCTHAMLIAAKAIPVLLEERMVWTKIDLALCFGAYRRLKVYTVLPRICDQRGTVIAP